MSGIVARPADLPVTVWLGSTHTAVLSFPPGIVDMSWSAEVVCEDAGIDEPLMVAVEDDVLTVTFDPPVTEIYDTCCRWTLYNGDGEARIVGEFSTTTEPGPSTTTATVVIEETEVTVVVEGSEAPVTSVNGQTGDVVLDAADVGADPAGSAQAVADDLADHEGLTIQGDGAHGGPLSAADVGADAAGSAAAVQTALDDLEDTLVRPAMTVVAASDAPAAMLARADVVCSGTDDQVEISAALVDGDVQLTAGTYSIGDTGDPFILAGTDDRWLRGVGPATLIRLAPRNRAAGPENFGVIEIRGPVERVRVSDLTIDGNRAAHSGTAPGHPMDWGEGCNIVDAFQVGVWNLTIIDANADGIDFDDSADCWAHDLHVSGSGGWGVHISLGTTRTRVSGCTIAECGQTAGQERGGFDCTTSDNIVENMIVTDCNNLTAFVTGDRQLVSNVHATGTPGVLVEGNIFLPSDGCSLTGFRMDGTGAPSGPTVGDRPLQLGPGATTNTLIQGWRTTGYADPINDQATDTRLIQCATDDGVSEQSGTATIADAASTEVVPHGLFAVPSVVTVTPRDGELVWVSARDATTFTVERAGSSGALAVDWAAQV